MFKQLSITSLNVNHSLLNYPDHHRHHHHRRRRHHHHHHHHLSDQTPSSTSPNQIITTIIITTITINIITQVLTSDEDGERVAAVYRAVNRSEWTKVEIPLRYDVNLITIGAGATDKTLNQHGYVAIDDLYIHRGECRQKGQRDVCSDCDDAWNDDD